MDVNTLIHFEVTCEVRVIYAFCASDMFLLHFIKIKYLRGNQNANNFATFVFRHPLYLDNFLF